jgi:acyl-coenzyme A thioesterase PaaI-like protein
MAELVLPNDANPLGALLGGRLMHWIDLAGAMAVHRHSRSYAVTASVDHIDFLVPVKGRGSGDSEVVGEPGLSDVGRSGGEGVSWRITLPTRHSMWHRPT